MSTLQVANIHLESTGNNRIQYDGSNTFTIAAGDANVAVVNSTSVSVSTDMSVDGNTTANTLTITGDTTANAVNATSVSVSGTQVVNSSAGLTNIAAIDSTTATAIENSIDVANAPPTINVITANTTYDKPTGLVGIKVTVIGGGGNRTTGGPNDSPYYVAGGGGGATIKYIPAPSIPAPVTVTVGTAQQTSSFGTYATATGASTITGGVGANGDIDLSGGRGQPQVPGGVAGIAYGHGTLSYGLGADGNPNGSPTGGVVIVEEFY